MAFPTSTTAGGTTAQVIAPNLSQFARGISAIFEVDMFDDAPANTTAAVPANPATDPSWSVVTPDGVTVASGVGVPGSAPGRWTATWNVPPDADLSTQSNKWRIVWNMVTQTGRQLQETLPFDVIELRTPDTLEDLRSESYVVYQGKTERIIIRLPKEASELTVEGFAPTSLDNPCPSDTATFSGSLVDSTIEVVEEQNMFAYYMDTPALTEAGNYQVVWNYRYTATSPSETSVQRLSVPPKVYWALAQSLKKLIDKLQKKMGTIQAYTDDDMFEYLQQGVGIMNGVTPVTNWSLDNFPYASTTVRFLIEAAALWAMNAQQLVAGELAFSFSGQAVTLDLDQTSTYGEIAQRLIDDLTSDGKGSWPATKVGIMRQVAPIAVVGNRSMGRWDHGSLTYKLYSDRVGANQQPLLQTLPGPGVNFGHTLAAVQVYLGIG